MICLLIKSKILIISETKYYNIDEIQSLHKLNDEHSLSLFHINACSPSKNIEDLDFLFDSTQICFEVIAITKFPVNDINFTNYSYEYCSTESSPGAILLYIGNHLSYKPINDLRIYKTPELEPTFIALINTKKSNVIIGVIYRHPNMDFMNLMTFNLLLH